MGAPPYSIALSGATPRLRQQLLSLLLRSALFVEPPTGAEPHTAVQLTRAVDEAGIRAKVSVLATVRVGTEIALRGRGRTLVLRLASAIHRYHGHGRGPYLDRIAFVAGTGEDPRARHIFSIGFDGAGVRRHSSNSALNLLPAWSPTGELAFTSYVHGAPELLLVPAGGGPAYPLPRHGGLNTGAAFSPDGRAIALTISRGGNSDIYLLDRRGRIIRRVTNHPGIDISPSWSPDGRQLAFVSDRSGSPQVYVTTVSRPASRAGEPRRLTSKGSYNQEPAWCPRQGKPPDRVHPSAPW